MHMLVSNALGVPADPETWKWGSFMFKERVIVVHKARMAQLRIVQHQKLSQSLQVVVRAICCSVRGKSCVRLRFDMLVHFNVAQRARTPARFSGQVFQNVCSVCMSDCLQPRWHTQIVLHARMRPTLSTRHTVAVFLAYR